MKIIGITGASGSGKTTISQILDKRNDVKVINADKMARNLTTSKSEYFEDVKKAFANEDIILSDGSLNRKKMAQIIYNDDEKLQILNCITFKHLVPQILAETKNASEEVEIIVIDAPLLFEAKINEFCDYIITFEVPYELKVDRICRRDNITKEVAKNRLAIQNDNEFYVKRSDFIIINDENTTLEDLERKINDIIYKIK